MKSFLAAVILSLLCAPGALYALSYTGGTSGGGGSTSWSSITGIPGGFADGTDDTGASGATGISTAGPNIMISDSDNSGSDGAHAFRVYNTTVAYITAGGRLGIGNDLTPDGTIEIVPAAADTYALLVSSQNGSTNLFFVNGITGESSFASNVGIGVADPASALDIVNTGDVSQAASVASGNYATLILSADTNNNASNVSSSIRFSNDNAYKAEIGVQDNNGLWLEVDGTAGFSTPQMSILSTGYVGIGNTAPATILDVSSAAAGVGLVSRVYNTSNTAGSAASQQVVVGGTSADDPYTRWQIAGGQAYAMGIDNSDSDALEISSMNVLDSGTLFRLTNAGALSIIGGLTAGSGSVAIIDSTGKIPALSSTYLADLSGANLTSLNDDNVVFDDADSNFAATAVGPAIEELDDVNGSGPNAADGKVDWSQLVNVPAGFADGTDATSAGGGDDLGNHVATTTLNMANFQITNANNITSTGTITGNIFAGSGSGPANYQSSSSSAVFGVSGGTSVLVLYQASATVNAQYVLTASSIGVSVQAYDAQLADLADGSLSGAGTVADTALSANVTTLGATITLDEVGAGVAGANAYDFGGATSLEIPNSDNPTVDAAGEVALDTDGWLRVSTGTSGTQYAIRYQEEFDLHVSSPNALPDAERDAYVFFTNKSGMNFIVTGWDAWSDTDNTTLAIEEIDNNGANPATVDAVECATDGTGGYYASDTTITAATVENGHRLQIDFDDTDTPGSVHIVIYGYYDGNVN